MRQLFPNWEQLNVKENNDRKLDIIGNKIMNNKVIKSVVLFTIIFGFQSLVTSQIITMDRYILDLLFILFLLFFLILYFRKDLTAVVYQTNRIEVLILLAISVAFHIVSSYFIIKFVNQPVWPFDSKGTSFLLMNNYYLFVKPLDVLLQQLLVFLLVTKLREYKMTLKQIIVLLVFGFGVIHIFQIFRTDFIVGLGYTIMAIVFSLIFPYMIIKVKNGCIYNFMIHLAVYNIAALIAWTLY